MPRLQSLWLLAALIFCCAAPALRAQQSILTDADIRQETLQAVRQTQLGFDHAQASIKPRKDLEELLASLRAKESEKKVYFYEMESPSDALGTTATSIAAVVHSAGAMYQLFSFEGSRQISAFSEEFNRLVSTLALSISKNDAVSFAKLFLQLSAAGNPGNILADETELRLSVQNYYFSKYRDTWKMLDAYAHWWEQFRVSQTELGPKVAVNGNGDYDLVLQTLLTFDYRHPQVQQIDLTISPVGMVHVRDIRSVFPDQSRWMFYDYSLPRPETFR